MANDNYIKLIKEVGTAMGGMRSNNNLYAPSP